MEWFIENRNLIWGFWGFFCHGILQDILATYVSTAILFKTKLDSKLPAFRSAQLFQSDPSQCQLILTGFPSEFLIRWPEVSEYFFLRRVSRRSIFQIVHDWKALPGSYNRKQRLNIIMQGPFPVRVRIFFIFQQ